MRESLSVHFSSSVGLTRDIELFEQRIQEFFKKEGWDFIERIYRVHPKIKGKMAVMSFKK